MKPWFARFRISSAMDARKPLPDSLRKAMARHRDLRQFANVAKALDHALPTPPKPPVPSKLHGDIMRAIRQQTATPRRPVILLRPGFIAASAMALVLVSGIWWINHRPARWANASESSSKPLVAAATALQDGTEFVRTTPDAAMTPLVTELADVHSDLNGAAQFLLASLP